METVVIGYQPQPDELCELLLLTTTNGILQQLTSVSHGLHVNSFGRQRMAAEPKLGHRSRKESTNTPNVKEKSDGRHT
jgi:hypothetical protein